MAARRIGRSAASGQFISLSDAERHPATSVIETIRISDRSFLRRRRLAARRLREAEGSRASEGDKDL